MYFCGYVYVIFNLVYLNMFLEFDKNILFFYFLRKGYDDGKGDYFVV